MTYQSVFWKPAGSKRVFRSADALLREWRFLLGVGYLVGDFFASELLENRKWEDDPDGEARRILRRLTHQHDLLGIYMSELYRGVHTDKDAQSLGDEVFQAFRQAMQDNPLYPEGDMCQCMIYLVNDAMDATRGRAQLRGAYEIFEAMEAGLAAYQEQLDDDGPKGGADIDPFDLSEHLYAVLFPQPRVKAPERKLFLVGGRFYVAAGDRAQAKECVRHEYGITGLKVSGINPKMKMADGRPFAALLASAVRLPAIVARDADGIA